jgi:hypothetical protein
MQSFVWTLIKLLIASLVVGTILTHLGITAETLLAQAGLTAERLEEIARAALAWALPNVTLGALVIVPVWFVIFLFRPPRRSSE